MGFDDLLGSLGVALLLVAFAANAFGAIDREGRAYHGLNAIGAGLACTASILIGFLPFVVLEGVWCLVAVAAWLRSGLSDPSTRGGTLV